MRLKHIKLSGFKSFVDTTKVTVTNQLIGIVGPNGCGKSNVIDAIRWVMGESSAKTLRGDNMEDVIFNGSAARKPVNKAFVELVFDNADGSAPGTYAKYAEIAIRRELVRDGGSKYFINKAKCRRKDIQDIFLGTGLGPRSYSIIEQGMVGRIVESKPEDLRVLIEEAAGISKYKERRRETENRIRHTRDNLSRVEDIISELETQLRRLKRQANEAERYKTFKQEQRTLEGLVKTLKWGDLHGQVKLGDVELQRLQAEFDSQMSDQRNVESQIETMRAAQAELNEAVNQAQARYYSIGGEISALEQSIRHASETRSQQESEFARLESSQRDVNQNLESDQSALVKVEERIGELMPKQEQLQAAYEQHREHFEMAEKAYQDWLSRWELVNKEAANPEREKEVLATRIEQRQEQAQQIERRQQQVVEQLAELDININSSESETLKAQVAEIDEACVQLESMVQNSDQQISLLRADIDAKREQYNACRQELHEHASKLASLETLQKAALGDDAGLQDWLAKQGLSQNQRLAGYVHVDAGWEKAVDIVLGRYLNSIVVTDVSNYIDDLKTLAEGRVYLMDGGETQAEQAGVNELDTLASKVTADGVNLSGLFFGVYAVENSDIAAQKRDTLKAHEYMITPDGTCIGSNWSSGGVELSPQSGILERDAEIEKLQKVTQKLDLDLQAIQESAEAQKNELEEQEKSRIELRNELRNKTHSRTDLHNQLGKHEARNAEFLARREALVEEQMRLTDQVAAVIDDINSSRKLRDDAQNLFEDIASQRADLEGQKHALSSSVDDARIQERVSRDEHQAVQGELDRLLLSKTTLVQNVERANQQLLSQASRREELLLALQNSDDPSEEMKMTLQGLLESRLSAEGDLSSARDSLNNHENQLKEREQQRLKFDRSALDVREKLEKVRMARQEIKVRRDTIAEEMNQSEEQMLKQVQSLDEGVQLQSTQQQLDEITRKVDRIGAVNLMAIDEYEQCSERKVYLDQQHADLTEAMETLESAINKIDRETRTRFKETFDDLNAGFKEFFPKLFGGGSAYLELTSNDMLDTGVAVMARPPGKRNSTIHLLSGGEKALTAVSLLFAFFDLNPAPFCVLDEVDAPLDDANVERYANVLKQLGEKTQLLFITHNKITMEVSDILVGVTMGEPGVSRLVAVDVEEAANMAALN
jgi:chromosome segregation protein